MCASSLSSAGATSSLISLNRKRQRVVLSDSKEDLEDDYCPPVITPSLPSSSSNRDGFPASVRRALARRVAHHCSNPLCNRLTLGPSADMDSVDIGEAAHICAASPGGPRYDSTQTPQQRKSINNGVWLCPSCHTLIDNDADQYTAEKLLQWKKRAEEEAKKALNNGSSISRPASIRISDIQPISLKPARFPKECCPVDLAAFMIHQYLTSEGAEEVFPAHLPLEVTAHHHHLIANALTVEDNLNPVSPVDWETQYTSTMVNRIKSRLLHVQQCQEPNTVCRVVIYKYFLNYYDYPRLNYFIVHCIGTPEKGQTLFFNPFSKLKLMDYSAESIVQSFLSSNDDPDVLPIKEFSGADVRSSIYEHLQEYDYIDPQRPFDQSRYNILTGGITNPDIIDLVVSQEWISSWHDQIELYEDYLSTCCCETVKFYSHWGNPYTLMNRAIKWIQEQYPNASVEIMVCAVDAMLIALVKQKYRLIRYGTTIAANLEFKVEE